MDVLLIQPSRYLPDGRVYKSKRRWLLGMTLPYVAALTPPDVRVRIKDDLYDDITFRERCDLVGLTCMTHQARRAYDIADGFRRRGTPVVMGGFHATLATDEAAQHVDAIVWGEAEYTWPRLVRDVQAGRLQALYRADRAHDLADLPVPRYDLIDLRRYRIPNLPAQTTRGCPHACKFCEVSRVYGGRFRHRPVYQVIDEIRALMTMGRRRFVYFVDDIFNAHRAHAMAVIEQLMPLGIHWTCLCTASVGDDADMLDRMRASGCVHINIGMETVEARNLAWMGKTQNRVDRYARQFAAIRRRGIDFSLNVMFGLDADTAATFETTVAKLIEYRAPTSYMFILAPRPGLPVRDELAAEGRLLDADWSRYTGFECVFQPKRMTVAQLEERFWWAHRAFYSIGSIWKRLLWPPRRFTLQALVPNLYFAWCTRRRIHPLTYY